MTDYPNLAGVATENLTSQIGAGSYSASYINWARTMHLLRVNAPGWLPELVQAADGGYVHRSPVGGFLLIRFVHADGSVTPAVPQSVMDNRNNAIPFDKINSRDVTDTHVRGLCKAAALTFGLAYELWAKMPLESGYAEQEVRPEESTSEQKSNALVRMPPKVGQEPKPSGKPHDGIWDGVTQEKRDEIYDVAIVVAEYFEEGQIKEAHEYLERKGYGLSDTLRANVGDCLNSKIKTALRNYNDSLKEAA